MTAVLSPDVTTCRRITSLSARPPSLTVDLPHLDEDRGDVVHAAAVVRHVDQLTHRLFEIVFGLEPGEEVLVRDHARQAVGAQEEAVARTHGHLDEVDRNVRGAAERARYDVLERVALGFVLAQDAGVDLLLNPRVVVRETPKLSIAKEVGAAVAHVYERRAVRVEERRHDGRAHALQLGPVLHGPHDLLVRLFDRRREPVPLERDPAVEPEGPRAFVLLLGGGDVLLNRLDGDPRGDLTRGVAAHAVGDHEKAALGVEEVGVLVVTSLPADVGESECGDAHAAIIPSARRRRSGSCVPR